MKIIKRNGAEVGFDITKIIVAITKANESVEEVDRMTPVQIQRIAESVELQCQKMNRAPPWRRFRTWWSTISWPTGLSRWPSTTSPTAIPAPWCAGPIPPTTRSSPSSSATTRRPSRRTPIRTRW